MVRAIAKTLFLSLLVVGGSVSLFFFYNHNSLERKNAALQEKNDELEQIRQRLETDRRVARIVVTDQKIVDGKLKTTLLFSESNRDGSALPAKQFTIDGNEAHFDAEVIKFKDQYVEKNDLFKGQSILLFVRVYGANQAPADGFPIDEPGSIPEIYRGTNAAVSDFELDLWKNFWQLYNDKGAREARGIRGLQGEGLYGQFEMNHIYTITLRPDGDGTINEEPIDPLFRQNPTTMP